MRSSFRTTSVRQPWKAVAILLFAWGALFMDQEASAGEKKVLRAGIIGADTSHCTAFTRILNDPKNADLGVKVVACFPGGSPDIPASRDRVEGFTKQLRDKHGVKIVDSVEELVGLVDVVLLESVDGRPHLKQATPVLKARKPLFIDKPIAGSLADCLKIFALAKVHQTPVFSSSALRFAPRLKEIAKVGKVLGCSSWSPCSLEPHHPDLFWYGVHGVEALFAVMGTGCKQVTRSHTPDMDVVVGVWDEGRIGTYRGLRKGKSDYGVMVFGQHGILASGGYQGYDPLVREICTFFHTGRPPVSAEETIEMFAFMEAADESKRQGGAPVTLESVLKKAR